MRYQVLLRHMWVKSEGKLLRYLFDYFFFFSHELSLVKSVFFSEHTVGCLFTRTETWADWNIHENIHYDTFKGFWEFYVISRKIFEVYEKQIQWKTTLQISSVKLLSDFANTVYSSKQGKRNFWLWQSWQLCFNFINYLPSFKMKKL